MVRILLLRAKKLEIQKGQALRTACLEQARRSHITFGPSIRGILYIRPTNIFGECYAQKILQQKLGRVH